MANLSFTSSAARALALEYRRTIDDAVEGCRVKLEDENDLFNWQIAIFGPIDTPYEGGYFKAYMKFPRDYPYSPPSIRFTSKILHPNIYEKQCISHSVGIRLASNHLAATQNGDLCISILHPPIDDPQSGEHPSERWNPTQNVRTILLSVISLLNEPNTQSPANVDASVMYRRWKASSNPHDEDYIRIIRRQVECSQVEAQMENVVIPRTIEEWCMTTNKKQRQSMRFADCSSSSGAQDVYDDFFIDDGYDDYDDDDDCCSTDDLQVIDDSGTESTLQ